MSGASSSASTSLDHSVPVYTSSTHPAHVRLNLQIQQFIESFRQLAPSSPSSSTSSIASLTSSMVLPGGSGHLNGGKGLHGSSAMGVDGLLMSHTGAPTGLSASGSGGSHKVTLTNALTAAQGLHTEAKKLSPEVRATYLQEIKDVGALFAYTDPETSILKGFLDQHRRIALADQVNRAILSELVIYRICLGLSTRHNISIQSRPLGRNPSSYPGILRIRRSINDFLARTVCAADNSNLRANVRARSGSETSVERARDRRRGSPGGE